MASNEIPLLGPILSKMFGSRNERIVKRLNALTHGVNEHEPAMRRLSDDQLRAKTQEFRDRIAGGASPEQVMPEVFAVAREAMDRAVGIRNIFNPKHREAFAVSKLPEALQQRYHALIAEMDAAEPRQPTGDLLGNESAQPGWVWMDIPHEFYDAVREIYTRSRPPFRARPFDVQLIGGIVLFEGKIAEMKTGEGKTIVAPLASYLACCQGLQVHVVTVNDYLVQRDRDWVFPFFRALGLTVGAIHPQHMQGEDAKRNMYLCDVVYGTTAEFGFDFLRDNMKRSVDQQVQRGRRFAIVDEVDSILIDEARTPLIITGPAHQDQPRYDLADKLARHLVQKNRPWDDMDRKVEQCKMRIKGTEGDIRNARDKSQVPALQERLKQYRDELVRLEAQRDEHTRYFEVDKDKKQATLTHHGVSEAQKIADVGSFYVGGNIDLPHLTEQALRAHVVFEKDRDYVIMPTQDPMTGKREPDAVIVDTNTGRPMIGRQWSDGLHQAVQSKEGVRVRPETQTVATVTIQNYYKMYERLAGMTGTADTEAQEFNDIYKLDVVVIPTNVPVVRRDFDDTVYLAAKDKWAAIVDEVKDLHDVGRPVLVGTTSVEKSEMLSRMLKERHGIEHRVLNAKHHESEAEIIEGAGGLGAVMIATNMAGRGTDIKLARVTREALIRHWQLRSLAPRDLSPEDSDEQVREKIYRKIAPQHLDIQKREAESMPFEELELALLRHWAINKAWADPKRVESMNPEQLRETIDAQGRFLLHRIGWVETVEQIGGLHVIGTERHESRRIDNQLRGRSGRQGDRGSSRFFVSLEDDLMQMFAGETTMRILSRMGMKEGDAIEHPMLSKSIARAQRKVEERNFQVRKNILEYDEVMEHQRQAFYGMRQRVLEGRELRALITDFIERSVSDAVYKYLDKGYRDQMIAEWANAQLKTTIAPERLRGKDREDLDEYLRREAVAEARTEIEVTIGEYIPENAEIEDMDVKGLNLWADERFGDQISVEQLAAGDLKSVKETLAEAAEKRAREADLSPLDQYLVPDYGPKQLQAWLRATTGFEIPLDQLTGLDIKPENAVENIMNRIEEHFDRREVEYPVDFMMEMTMALMRQNPQAAAQQLLNWANTRYRMGWDDSVMRTKMPQQLRDELIRASREFFESGTLEKETEKALALAHDDERLAAHFRERFGVGLPPWIFRSHGPAREALVKSRVESILRAELVNFERFVTLDVLDNNWREHLGAMDRLRDSIGYRAFSQQDPRIEYKREGSRLFADMNDKVRERVTEYTFRARLAPQMGMPRPPMQSPAPAAAQAPQQPQPAPAGANPAAQTQPQQQAPARPSGGAALLNRSGGTVGMPINTMPLRDAESPSDDQDSPRQN
ncbi:MAG: preprotein translocase subunit SecA [Phycisphaerales bacterium]